MSAAQADAALLGLAKDIFADVTACQVMLAEVRSYERRGPHGVEEVRSYDRIFVHDPSLGGEPRKVIAAELERQRGFLGRAAGDVEVHVTEHGEDPAGGVYTPHRIELHPVLFGPDPGREDHYYVPADKKHPEAAVALAHELGHHVAEVLGEDTAMEGISRALGIGAPDLPADPQKRWSAKYNWWGKAEPRAGKQISRYAGESASEAGAELWAEYTLNKHPRPAARKYGEFARSHLAARGML